MQDAASCFGSLGASELRFEGSAISPTDLVAAVTGDFHEKYPIQNLVD